MVMGINLQLENLHLGELLIEFLIFKKALKGNYNQQNIANEACLHVSGTFAM